MKIEYTLTRDDYFQYYLYMRERRRDRWRRWRWYPFVLGCRWVASFAVGFLVAYLIWRSILYLGMGIVGDDPRVFGGLAALCTVLAAIVYPFVHNWRTPKNKYSATWDVRLTVRLDEGQGKLLIGCRCRLEMNTEELVLNILIPSAGQGAPPGVRVEMRMPWAWVDAIEESDLHAFVIPKKGGGIFIPKSAFGDVLAFRDFVEEAQRLWMQSPTATAITAAALVAPIETAFQREKKENQQGPA